MNSFDKAITGSILASITTTIWYIHSYYSDYKKITGVRPPHFTLQIVEGFLFTIIIIPALCYLLYSYEFYYKFLWSNIGEDGAIISVLIFGTYGYIRVHYICKPIAQDEETRKKLINIDGVESPDDIEFRLHELRRYRSRKDTTKLSQKKLDEIDDAILRLEQRKRGDSSFDTIIGYER